MIGKVVRGKRVGGLMRYLFGPGTSNEHTDCHLAAAWDDPASLEPPTATAGWRDVRTLTGLLEQPVLASPKVPPRPVWHCVLRAAPGDRRLSDAEWDDVARHVLDRTGLAPRDDDGGCRWAAVRHADDHVHLVVTLARQDGRPVSTSNDFYRLGQACREMEVRLDLTRTAARDRTAARRPSRGEQEKADRAARPEPPRTTLRLHVSLAAATSATSEEFFADLGRSGLLVRKRYSEFDPDVITGYAVALPGDRNADHEPVWFSGGKLAADLTWPALEQRWAASALTPLQPAPDERAEPLTVGPPVDVQRHLACDVARRAASAGQAAVLRLTAEDAMASSDIGLATGDLLMAAARMAEGRRGGPLTGAAEAYGRAGREPWGRPGRTSAPGTALRSAARLLARTGRLGRSHAEDFGDLLSAAAGLVDAIAVLRAAQGRSVQAAAARDSAAVLHQAARAAAARPGRTSGPRRRRPLPSRAVASPTASSSGGIA